MVQNALGKAAQRHASFHILRVKWLTWDQTRSQPAHSQAARILSQHISHTEGVWCFKPLNQFTLEDVIKPTTYLLTWRHCLLSGPLFRVPVLDYSMFWIKRHLWCSGIYQLPLARISRAAPVSTHIHVLTFPKCPLPRLSFFYDKQIYRLLDFFIWQTSKGLYHVTGRVRRCQSINLIDIQLQSQLSIIWTWD